MRRSGGVTDEPESPGLQNRVYAISWVMIKCISVWIGPDFEVFLRAVNVDFSWLVRIRRVPVLKSRSHAKGGGLVYMRCTTVTPW